LIPKFDGESFVDFFHVCDFLYAFDLSLFGKSDTFIEAAVPFLDSGFIIFSKNIVVNNY
jgi:hypothetical protein